MDTTETRTASCVRCGRKLTSAKSIARGYGAHCASRIRHAGADLSRYDDRQVAAAVELIEDGGVVALTGPVFLTISTDGTEIHRTSARTCNCKSGIRADINRRPCYHTAAVRMMLAA